MVEQDAVERAVHSIIEVVHEGLRGGASGAGGGAEGVGGGVEGGADGLVLHPLADHVHCQSVGGAGVVPT